ncbi:MAG: DUF1570 domain-containing protein [Tepidisphaeraceae bacterium]
MTTLLTITCASLVARGEPALASAPTTRPTDADFARHVDALRDRLSDEFTVVVEKPFVVIGDESPGMVRRRATDTVGWAVEKLKRDYFDVDPDHVIDVWLFKDKPSYERNAKRLFGSLPHTPYGYYSPSDRALVMNIATGGGTLVHEIVHPFVAANFPKCPSWLNEGLGSLYEQSAERNGRIIGLTNWRLAGLQRAIRAKRLPSFEKLIATKQDEFYNDDRGDNYAQARYLCYYLQEKGLLTQFVRAFMANVDEDPTGYDTLKKTLGEEDMSAFAAKWEAYVMKLKFP